MVPGMAAKNHAVADAAGLATRIQVLLADDHPVVRSGYRNLIDSHPDMRVAAEAADCQQVLDACRSYRPDVVVLDLNMPGIGGIETIKRLLHFAPALRVLVFSASESEVLIERSIQAGALGYLLKSSQPALMIDAIRLVVQGKVFVDPQVAMAVAAAHLRGDGSPLAVLTPREFEVFRQLAQGSSVSEIAEQLFISQKTAGTHQTNIMSKLKLANSVQLVHLAIRCKVIDIQN